MSATHGTDLVQITIFPNFAAATKHEKAICLPDLADLIITTSAVSKGNLPWLKLATFGDLRSDKNSLRHNPNVLTITGIEADYDQERVSFNDAVCILAEAGVSAIVYTSPSNTVAGPRWRVLCPLSEPMPPEQRDLYMARLNGLFGGGIFARESWALSQGYFYGSVDHNPDHRVELVNGTPIDLMDELDATAIGKPDTKVGNGRATERPVGSGAAYTPASDVRTQGFIQSVLDTLRRSATDGAKHLALRNAALALGGIQVQAGFTDAEAVAWLLDDLPASVLDWDAAKQTAAWGLEQGRHRPIELENRPRVGNGTYVPPEPPPLHVEGDYRTHEQRRHHSDQDVKDEPPPHSSQWSGQKEEQKPSSSAASDDLITEGSVAAAFAHEHRDRLRYCHDTGAWYHWDGAI